MAHVPDAIRPDPGAPCLLLLGSFRLERGGRTIHFHTRQVESLLAFLALYPEAHSREKLAALLWGDMSDEQARMSLGSALSTLRQEPGEDLVPADRKTLQLPNPARKSASRVLF